MTYPQHEIDRAQLYIQQVLRDALARWQTEGQGSAGAFCAALKEVRGFGLQQGKANGNA